MSTDTKYADPEDAREWAAKAKKAYIHCRRYGHHWGPHDASPLEGGHDEEIAECRVCHAVRTETLDADGDVLASSIDYPKDYLLKPGTGRMVGAAKGVLRRAILDGTYVKKASRRR